MIRLRQGQGLNIGSDSYIVTGCISYRSGSNRWDEYTLKNASGGTAWLSVDSNSDELVLSQATYSQCPSNYRLVDKGTAVVTSHFGSTDVDVGEKVRYSEYEDNLGNYTYSVEEWEDETECSSGRYISEAEIQLLDTPPFESQSFYSYNNDDDDDDDDESSGGSIFGKIIVGAIAIISFIVAPVTSCLLGSSDSDICEECSPSDPNYEQCKVEYNNCIQTRSVRQTSRRTRSSSGGGTSYGK